MPGIDRYSGVKICPIRLQGASVLSRSLGRQGTGRAREEGGRGESMRPVTHAIISTSRAAHFHDERDRTAFGRDANCA